MNIMGKTYIAYVADVYLPGYNTAKIEVSIPALFPNLGTSYVEVPKRLSLGGLLNSNFPKSGGITKRTSITMPLSKSSYEPPSIPKGTKVNVVFLTNQIGSGHIIFNEG